MTPLVRILTSQELAERNRSLEHVIANQSVSELLATTRELDTFRRNAENLYERVRALAFLAAIHRFHLPATLRPDPTSRQRMASCH